MGWVDKWVEFLLALHNLPLQKPGLLREDWSSSTPGTLWSPLMVGKRGVHHQTGTPGILLLPQLLWKLWKGTQDQGDHGTHNTASGQRRNTDTCVYYLCPKQQMEGRVHAVKPTSSAAETKEENSTHYKVGRGAGERNSDCIGLFLSISDSYGCLTHPHFQLFLL